ncbi:hypothetical protein CCP3SC15_2820002 [Gammaproteobacteria bacterium]
MPYDQAYQAHIQHLFAQRIAAYPKSVLLECELTTRCLNNCSYCGADIREEKGEVDLDLLSRHLRAYAAYAKEKGSDLRVILVGGDPVLHGRFDELLGFLAANGIRYGVKGNASTLSRKRLERLKETGCMGVKLTCYGEAEVHDAHRGFDTFNLLVTRSRLARALGLAVIWHLSVSKENLDSLRRLPPFLHAMNLNAITEGRVGKLGRLAKDATFTDITYQEWRDFLLDLLHFHHRHWRQGFTLAFRDKLWVPLLVEEGLLDLEPFRGNGIRLGCDLAGDMATVDFRGYLKSCGLLEAVSKWYFTLGERTVFLAKETMGSTTGAACSRCLYHDFCRGCRAITLANTGRIDEQDPHCWVNRPVVRCKSPVDME